MAGFLCLPVLMEPPLGVLMLLRVLATWLRLLFGPYSPGLISEWSIPDGFDAVEAASRVLDAPNVWTDGSLVLDQVTGVFSSGAGFFCSSVPSFAGESVGGVMLSSRIALAIAFFHFCVLFLIFSFFHFCFEVKFFLLTFLQVFFFIF